MLLLQILVIKGISLSKPLHSNMNMTENTLTSNWRASLINRRIPCTVTLLTDWVIWMKVQQKWIRRGFKTNNVSLTTNLSQQRRICFNKRHILDHEFLIGVYCCLDTYVRLFFSVRQIFQLFFFYHYDVKETDIQLAIVLVKMVVSCSNLEHSLIVRSL